MSVLHPELFLRDEIEFELRARGRDPKGTVLVLRRQLREALSAGEALSKVTIADKESELEICNEKWEELRELARCVDSLEEGPGCSIGVRRIRQRLQHVIHWLQNLEEQWGDLEPALDIKDLIQQITSTLQGSQPARPPTPCLLYTSRCV